MPHLQSNTLTNAATMTSTSQTFPGTPVACSTSANMEHSLSQTCTASSHSFVAAFIPIQEPLDSIYQKHQQNSKPTVTEKKTSQILKLEATTMESIPVSLQQEMSVLTTKDSSILNKQLATTVAMTTERSPTSMQRRLSLPSPQKLKEVEIDSNLMIAERMKYEQEMREKEENEQQNIVSSHQKKDKQNLAGQGDDNYNSQIRSPTKPVKSPKKEVKKK